MIKINISLSFSYQSSSILFESIDLDYLLFSEFRALFSYFLIVLWAYLDKSEKSQSENTLKWNHHSNNSSHHFHIDSQTSVIDNNLTTLDRSNNPIAFSFWGQINRRHIYFFYCYQWARKLLRWTSTSKSQLRSHKFSPISSKSARLLLWLWRLPRTKACLIIAELISSTARNLAHPMANLSSTTLSTFDWPKPE